jgi:hypothetical protein
MAHDAGRQYRGWHHYRRTTMWAQFFLWHLKLHWGKKAPARTVSQLRPLLEVV